MKKYSLMILAAALLVAPVASQAAQFAVFGPGPRHGRRVRGRGERLHRGLLEPGGTGDFRKTDIRLSAGAAARDYADLTISWSDINNIYSAGLAGDPAAAAQLQQMLLDLDKPDSVTNSMLPAACCCRSLRKIGHGDQRARRGICRDPPTIDTLNLNANLAAPDSIANNNCGYRHRARHVEPAISLATSLLGDRIFHRRQCQDDLMPAPSSILPTSAPGTSTLFWTT